MENERMDYAARKSLVYATADELAASGIKPTMDMVRSKVGGSYSTLSKILGEWKREKAQEKVIQQAAPEVVTELASRMASEIWTAANSEAQLALVALRETITAENAELKQELASIIQTADVLQRQAEDHEVVLSALKRELDEANTARHDATAQLQMATANLSQRDMRIEELKSEVAELRAGGAGKGLKEELETLRLELSRLADQYAKLSSAKS